MSFFKKETLQHGLIRHINHIPTSRSFYAKRSTISTQKTYVLTLLKMLTSPVMRNLADDGAIPGTGNTGDESRKWELSWVGGGGEGGGGDAGSACPCYIYFLWDRKQSTDVIITELFIFSQTV
jgi:hypothetical protein